MDPSDTGGMGWLSSLLGANPLGQAGPQSLTAPGQAAPTPDSAGMPTGAPDPNAPSLMKGIAALGQTNLPKPAAAPQAPQIQMPQPHQQPYAQALAQVMAQLNAKPQQGALMPQGTQ